VENSVFAGKSAASDVGIGKRYGVQQKLSASYKKKINDIIFCKTFL